MVTNLYTTDSARPLGQGRLSPAGSVLDSEIAAQVRGYKRTVAGRYRALVQDELLTATPHGPLLVSPKIDGELWFLVIDGKDAFLASPTGRVVSGDIPVLQEAAAAAGKAHPRTVIAGEFFAARKGGRPRVGDLAAAMGGEAKAEVDRLAFAAFDTIHGGHQGAPERNPLYADRLTSLNNLLDGGKRLRAIKTESVSGGERVAALFDEWVEGGKGEGLVIRTADNTVFKAKPSISVDAAIIGYTESSDGPDKVGSFLLGMMREDGQFQVIGSCGNMPTEEREAFMRRLPAAAVESNYRHANSKGALYRFVRPEIVVEVKVTDIQSEDSSGEPIERMVLEWVDGRWRAVRQMSGASLLHPVFVRVRDDKSVNSVDIRVAQVLERCLVEGIDRHAERLILPPSAVLRREVYTKVAKGETAVRKLLLWQTHKEALDPSYPPYVVHFTDFSAGRKDPLQREVRLAPTLAEAQAIADELLAENIKKGWDRR
jgi:hypothetical protein